MWRARRNDARQVFLPVNHDLLALQDSDVNPADRGNVQKATLDFPDHEADFVQVTCKHDSAARLGSLATAQGNNAPHGVEANLIGIWFKRARDDLANPLLVP
jgi:hypothetical protein